MAGTAREVFNNPVVEIDAAAPGSELLNGLARVHSAEAWLEAFKFVGIAFFFLGIVNGLHTVVFALRYQRTAIPQVAEKLPAVGIAAPIPADD